MRIGSILGAGLLLLGSAALAAEPATTPASSATPLASFGFTKLVVADLDRAAAFYTTVCGLVETRRIDAEIGGRPIREILYAPASAGGATFVLLAYLDAKTPAANELILGFSTPDLPAFLARAKAAGGSVHQDLRKLDEMKIAVAFVKDPEGHLIEVIQPL
jgi:predicted enzyme related to lactoylglutathione lyase